MTIALQTIYNDAGITLHIEGGGQTKLNNLIKPEVKEYHWGHWLRTDAEPMILTLHVDNKHMEVIFADNNTDPWTMKVSGDIEGGTRNIPVDSKKDFNVRVLAAGQDFVILLECINGVFHTDEKASINVLKVVRKT
jgi:hypothetical protein